MGNWLKLIVAIALIYGCMLLAAFCFGVSDAKQNTFIDVVDIADQEHTDNMIYLDTVQI